MTESFKVHSMAAAKARKATQERPAEVHVRRVAHWDLIYPHALKLAQGDPTRVVVTRDGEVIVRNRGKHDA